MKQWDQQRREVGTTSLWSISGSQNTADELAKSEKDESDRCVDVNRIKKALNSLCRNELEQQVGSQMFSLWESNQLRPRVADDLIEESGLESKYPDSLR